MNPDVDKARSSERYDSVDWWRLDVHDLGFEPRLIWTPATVTPLLRWLSTKHNLIDLAKKAFPASESKSISKKVKHTI